MDITIIIPVKDEEESIGHLAHEVSGAMAETQFSWECLWIDDGSTDDTLKKLEKICKEDNHHRVLSLDKNYGQSAAMAVGFKNTKADILVTLDGDGQNDPKDIPALVKQLINQKADVVNGWRKNREDSIIRKISSRIGNGFRNKLTHENVRDVGVLHPCFSTRLCGSDPRF